MSVVLLSLYHWNQVWLFFRGTLDGGSQEEDPIQVSSAFFGNTKVPVLALRLRALS